jgi:hypothetical protein
LSVNAETGMTWVMAGTMSVRTREHTG